MNPGNFLSSHLIMVSLNKQHPTSLSWKVSQADTKWGINWGVTYPRHEPMDLFGTSRGLLPTSEASLPSAKLFHLMKVEQNVKSKGNFTTYGILGLS